MTELSVTGVTAEHVADATTTLLATMGQLADADAAAPSLCEGWSRGHVATHVARNADGLARVLRSGIEGTGGTMYDSPAARDADIDAGAHRPARELLHDVRDSARELHGVLLRLRPEHGDRTVPRVPGGADVYHIPLRRVPFMRLREVVCHHVDLDAGFTFADVPKDVLALLVQQQLKLMAASEQVPDLIVHTDEGDDHTLGEGGTVVSGSRAAVLGWLTRKLRAGVDFSGPVPELPFGG